MVKLRIKKLHPDAVIPRRATEGAAGFDLTAYTKHLSEQSLSLYQGEYLLVPTGIAVAIPPGYEGQIRPRSGLAFQYGITVLNSPGTIDSDYRGEIKVLLARPAGWAAENVRLVCVNHGARIAQLVITPVPRVALEVVTGFDDTERGAGGFGSTGL